MSETGLSKKLQQRFERLKTLERCQINDVKTYASELKQLVDQEVSFKHIDVQNRVFKALANPTRLAIINLLRLREMCVCEIMVALNLTQPTASHHLNILETAGVVNDRKDGRWVFYSLNSPLSQKLFEFLQAIVK